MSFRGTLGHLGVSICVQDALYTPAHSCIPEVVIPEVNSEQSISWLMQLELLNCLIDNILMKLQHHSSNVGLVKEGMRAYLFDGRDQSLMTSIAVLHV